MFTKTQLEVINKIESIPWKGPFKQKLSLEEMTEQFKKNNPQGFHPRKKSKKKQ